MLLLAVDTSGKQGSIGLARGLPDGSCEAIDSVPLAGGTFSAQLVPQISALLSKFNFKKEDIGGFCVVSGPGSFTGLRVGLAAIKALAEVLNKPIAAVSLLEVIASSAKADGKVWAAIDAGRNEIYLGEYGGEGRSEQLVSREELAALVGAALVVTADRSIVEVAQAAGFNVKQIPYPGSDAVARLGWQKLQSSETASSADLEANYIRRSDAEIFRTNP
jgi:tRNA threonylcarbamoyladenosine biosynthesis protein TsaB